MQELCRIGLGVGNNSRRSFHSFRPMSFVWRERHRQIRICSNGMVIGETKAEIRDIHNKHMDLQRIPQIVYNGLQKVQGDLDRLQGWEKICFPPARASSVSQLMSRGGL